jgi:hypothetical protein
MSGSGAIAEPMYRGVDIRLHRRAVGAQQQVATTESQKPASFAATSASQVP